MEQLNRNTEGVPDNLDTVTNAVETLRAIGSEAGLVALGVTTADPFPDVREEMERRRSDGRAGRLRFTYSDSASSTNVRASLPWAERLVVGAVTYLPDAYGIGGGPGVGAGRIARFATADHYRPLRSALGLIARHLTDLGHEAEVLIDDNRLVDRAAAVRAGVGWWGKSTMVLAPKYGPWLLLGSVATDALLATTAPMTRDCGTCTACIPACPTGALDVPGVLDARRCISYWAQTPGVIPEDIREAWGNRLYGCDDCLEACPPGERWLETGPQASGVDLIDLLACTDAELLARYEHFYIPRRQARFLRRNALVALAHAGGPQALGVLLGFLTDRDWLLRLHAAWAVGRVGGPHAARRLRDVWEAEDHLEVRETMAAALEKAG